MAFNRQALRRRHTVAGDSAGLALNIGFTVRGMEYALASGYYAALSTIQAKEAGRFDSATLSCYQKFLEDSFVLRDFRSFKDAPSVLSNPRLFRHYPEMLGSIFRDIYNIPAGPKSAFIQTLKKYLTLKEAWSVFKDLLEVKKI